MKITIEIQTYESKDGFGYTARVFDTSGKQKALSGNGYPTELNAKEASLYRLMENLRHPNKGAGIVCQKEIQNDA